MLRFRLVSSANNPSCCIPIYLHCANVSKDRFFSWLRCLLQIGYISQSYPMKVCQYSQWQSTNTGTITRSHLILRPSQNQVIFGTHRNPLSSMPFATQWEAQHLTSEKYLGFGALGRVEARELDTCAIGGGTTSIRLGTCMSGTDRHTALYWFFK